MPPDPEVIEGAPIPNADPASQAANLNQKFLNLVQAVVNYGLEITSLVVARSKIPLTIYLLLSVSLVLFRSVVDTASSSLAPICIIFPSIPLCYAGAGPILTTAPDAPALDVGAVDFPSLMELQSRTLHQLLSQSAVGSQLALSIKQAELAVRDLGTLVQVSNLATKDALARSLEEFTVDAKATGRGLQKLSAKLYGAVDSILAFDEYALRKIAQAQASGASNVQDATAQTFYSSMNVLSSEISRVILETTVFIARLDALEERLAAIHNLCEHENVLVTTARETLFSDLWTYLGGNKAKIFQLTQQMFVLQNLGRYRSLAVAHVAATMEALGTIEADLVHLRDKLTAPGFVDDIPIEVHIASIERSARRLKEEKSQVDERRDVAYQLVGVEGSKRVAVAGEDSRA